MENETINLTETILNSINELFSQLFSSIDNTIYSSLDSLAFISPQILQNKSFQNILGTTASEGLLLICNSLVFGFILYYSINYLISHLTYSQIDTPKQFVFKAIIFIAIMNSSLWICDQIINIIYIITKCISELGNNLFGIPVNFSNFIDNINQNIYSSGESLNIFSFDGIIKSFTSFGLISLIFTYSLRYIMIQIFILISPFAFLSLITSNSEWFFKIWFKTFLSLLLVQILVSFILVLSFSIEITSNSVISKLLYIGIIHALTRANNYIKELFGGISTTISSGISSFSIN